MKRYSESRNNITDAVINFVGVVVEDGDGSYASGQFTKGVKNSLEKHGGRELMIDTLEMLVSDFQNLLKRA